MWPFLNYLLREGGKFYSEAKGDFSRQALLLQNIFIPQNVPFLSKAIIKMQVNRNSPFDLIETEMWKCNSKFCPEVTFGT